ncbi:hypothetical protein [Gordonia sp. NPDC003950]
MTNNVGNDQDTLHTEDEGGDEHSTDTVDTDSGSVGDGGQDDRGNDGSGSGDESGKGKASRQAARYRSERNQAREQVVALQEQIVSGMAESEGVKGAALLGYLKSGGKSVADLVDSETGQVSSEKVSETIGVMRNDWGLRSVPSVDRDLGRTDQDGKGSGDAGADWARAFGPREVE